MAESNAERKEVEEYLRKHNLQVVMNEVINSIIKERADHPLDAIARALQDRDEQGIIAVTGREVLDASGRPTIAVDVKTARGTFTASVPRGEKAEWAAVESRDADTSRYAGGGVTMAVKMVNEVIGPALVGLDPSEQKTVDKKLTDLDGTDDKSNFGANTILAVSMAVCRAGAAAKKKPLFRHLANLANLEEVCMPVPAFTVMEGGTNAYSNLPVKEILVMPTSAESFSEALRIGFEVYNAVRAAVAEKEDGEEPSEVFKGAAGGWAVEIDEFEDALQLLTAAVEKAGYTEQVRFAVNLDGNKLLVRPPTEEGEEEGKGEVDEEDEDRKYDLSWKLGDDSKVMESEELSKMLSELIEKYPIVSMEDPFANSDKATYTDFNTTLSEDLQVVGDKLVNSSSKRVRECEAANLINAITLRPLQVGTVTEVIATCQQVKKLNWGVVVASMPTETEDSFIADLAVGLRAGQLRAGAPVSMERLSKYNRLLCIEDELGTGAAYVGNQFRRPPEP